MPEFDLQRNRLSVKLVYYGPALSGKTTNLVRLHDMLDACVTGDMMTLETAGDRTLFFDLLPLGFATPSGLQVRFKLFTVPGQVAHDGTRKAVLSRADGVVFVADSQRDQAINNAVSFENLFANVRILGLEPSTLPVVVQFNKRDLADVVGEEEIRSRWGGTAWPLQFAAAMSGEGVLESFCVLLSRVYDRLAEPYQLANHGLTRNSFLQLAGARE